MASPEHRLLLLLAREELDAQALIKLEQLACACADPELVLRQIRAQKLSSFALKHLRASENLPRSFRAIVIPGLQKYIFTEWLPLRSYLNDTLRLIRSLLSEHNIPFAIIKGPAIAENYYNCPEFRSYKDIDILVKGDDFLRIEELFISNGLAHHADATGRKARRDYLGQVEFIHAPRNIVVDVNCKLVFGAIGNAGGRDITVDMDMLWGRAIKLDAVEHRLSPEDDLLLLVKHLVHNHGFEGVIRHCSDMGALLRKHAGALDWEYIAEQARRSECLRALRIFACFYDQHYRLKDDIEIGDKISARESRVSPRIQKAFETQVIFRQIERDGHYTGFKDYLWKLNLHRLSSIWSLDRLARLLYMTRTCLWPSEEELVLLTYYDYKGPEWARRLRWYYNPLMLSGGAILAGTTLFLLTSLSSLYPQTGHQDLH